MDNTLTRASDATMLVAIDGPAGSGKSSVSRAAAERLEFGILDTGAAYRALAWAALQLGIALDDEAALLALLEAWEYDISLRGEQVVTVRLPAEHTTGAPGAANVTGAAHMTEVANVTSAIRAPELSAKVSSVSKHPLVREQLNRMFRRLVAESGLRGVVIEGRDITTVVAPDAPVRILMTASAEVRAKRRAGELPGMSHAQVLTDIAARDAKDSLVVDFMNPAPGVELVDTSELDFEQSVQAVIDVVHAAQRAAEESE